MVQCGFLGLLSTGFGEKIHFLAVLFLGNREGRRKNLPRRYTEGKRRHGGRGKEEEFYQH